MIKCGFIFLNSTGKNYQWSDKDDICLNTVKHIYSDTHSNSLDAYCTKCYNKFSTNQNVKLPISEVEYNLLRIKG